MKKLLFLIIISMMFTVFSCSKSDDNDLNYLGKWFVYKETEDYGDGDIYSKELEGCYAESNFEFFPDNTVVYQNVMMCNDDGGYGFTTQEFTYNNETRKLVGAESGEEHDVSYSGNEMTITISYTETYGDHTDRVTFTYYCRKGG